MLEVPVPRLDWLPFHDARYLYTSTLHWKTLVNGYSGYYPRSYIERLIRLRAFPSASAINQMRFDKVRYVVVHEDRYPIRPRASVRSRRSSGSGQNPSDEWTTGGIRRRWSTCNR